MSSAGVAAAGPVPEPEAVLQALRFGWAIAELRGRIRQAPPSEQPPPRPEHALPLAGERTWEEQTIETASVLACLADELGLDVGLDTLSGQDGDGKVTAQLGILRAKLDRARSDHDEAGAHVLWEDACKLFYAWDAKVQDTLAGESFAVASGYQLGRGLAEVYWALDTRTGAPDVRSWEVLLGSVRVGEVRQLLKRLSAYFLPGVSVALEASLAAWQEVAADASLRARAETYEQLHEQLHVWHDALLIGQTPEARLAPKDLIARARRIGPIVRAFLPEASVALASLVAAGIAAGLFAIGGHTPALAPVLAVVSLFGVTSAGALAKAKDEAHSLFAQLQQAMNADLLEVALTLPPALAYLGRREPRSREPSRGPEPSDSVQATELPPGSPGEAAL